MKILNLKTNCSTETFSSAKEKKLKFMHVAHLISWNFLYDVYSGEFYSEKNIFKDIAAENMFLVQIYFKTNFFFEHSFKSRLF